MSWTCKLVEPAGKRYEVVYMSEQDNKRSCVIHSHRHDITKEAFDDPDKWEKFRTEELLTCEQCGGSFKNNSVSFSSGPIWNTADGELHIGDMYYGVIDQTNSGYYEHFMSNEYNRDWKGKRTPLYVVTPGGSWCVDGQASNASDKSGWTVTGTAPNITARPSIAMHNYHGWLTDGVLSDDLEGRKYEDRPIRY